MNETVSRPDLPAQAPEGFRSALAELVEIGMSVARLVGQVAEAQAVAAAASARTIKFVDRPPPESMAQAIEADRALTDVADAVAGMPSVESTVQAFARVSRSVRMTVLLAERLDRGWARRGRVDDRDAMEQRQAARVAAVAAGADQSRAERLGDVYCERLEEVEEAEDLGDRSTDDVLAEIHRGLGVNPLRQTVVVPAELPEGAVLDAAVAVAANGLPEGWVVQTEPWNGGICVPTTPWDRPPVRDAPG